MAYDTTVYFNTVYVLESLLPGDLRTGRELYDSVLVPAKHRRSGLETEYLTPTNRSAFESALEMIALDAERYNRSPILHLETHGNEDGLELSSGEFMPWEALAPALATINRSCQMNLVVMAAMCRGWHLASVLRPISRAPAFATIGPPQDISAGNLEAAVKLFYEKLVADLDVNEALEAMNGGKPYNVWQFRPATAEILFCRIFRKYVHLTDQNLQERQQEIVDASAARSLGVAPTPDLEGHILAQLGDHRKWYNHFRQHFLMLDLFPDIEGRFGMSYDECFHDV